MALKPLIPTAAISEFGDLTDQSDFKDPTGAGNDLSYVPGFTEMRRKNAEMMALYAKGECTRAEVPDLPVNLRWARAQTKAGVPDSEKIFRHEQKGFRLVNVNEHKDTPWLTNIPPGAARQADGTIRRGDTVLMVCDAKDARRNEAFKRSETERQLTGATENFSAAVNQAFRATNQAVPAGSEPSVQKMKADEPVFANVRKAK